MSITDGDIAERLDLRPNSIKTVHVRDDAIATAKIPDLAVTFPDKIDNPSLATAFEAAGSLLVTTTPTAFSTTIDVPAWADSAAVFAIAQLQVSNTTGAGFNAQVRCSVDGNPASGALSTTIQNNTTGSAIDFQRINLIGVAGSTITVSATCSINAGSPAESYVHVGGVAVFSR